MTQPLLFLDIDDVVCINAPYGGFDVMARIPPDDLYARLFHPPAAAALLTIMAEHHPRVILSTSWTQHMRKPRLVQTLRGTGLGVVAGSLHDKWRINQRTRMTRLIAIQKWLALHHSGEPFCVLDDVESGTGLQGSALDIDGRVVLCEVNVGLHAGHLPAVSAALAKAPGIRADLVAQIAPENKHVLQLEDLKAVGRLADKSGTVDVNIDDL